MLFKHLSEDLDIQSIEGKAKFAQTARELHVKMPRGVYQQLLQANLANRVGLNPEALETMRADIRLSRGQSVTVATPETTGIPTRLRNAMSSPLFTIHLRPLKLRHPHPCSLPLFLASKFLAQLLSICQQQPQLNTGSLLSYWDEHPARVLIGQLASQEPLIHLKPGWMNYRYTKPTQRSAQRN